MPVVFTLYNPNGTVNLDLTTKILRKLHLLYVRYASNPWTTYTAITNSNVTFNSYDIFGGGAPITVQQSGTAPSGSIEMHSCATDNAICYMSAGTHIYGCTDAQAVVRKIRVSEAWSNPASAIGKDMCRIYSPSGELMWSAGTLGDALMYVGTLSFTALNQVKTISSTTGRRLYINIASVFMSGTYTEDEGGSYATDSGINYRFRNNDRTVDVCYYSKNDNNISISLTHGALQVEIYEIYNE